MGEIYSRIPIKITVVGKGVAKAELNRLTAPLTVEEIVKRLPINTRVSPAMGFISILVNMKRGVEKPIDQVEAGTIAYWPRGDAICIYPKDFKPYGSVNNVGEILEGLELFDEVKSRSRIIIERA